MKRLLIPTDFSEISKNSIIYGFKLAEKLQLDVYLIHVLELYKFAAGTSETELISSILPVENIKEMEASATESFTKIMEELEPFLSKDVTYQIKVVSGHLINELMLEASVEETEMIVVAVSGSQDLISRFTNSTINALIEDSSCPVLIIPSGCSYKEMNKVILATDFRKADLDVLEKFITIYGKFNPEIKVLHISTKANDFKTELKFAGFKQLITEKIKYSNISFKLMTHKNTVQGITENLKAENADLLLMLKEHESFFKSLFETSKTEKITHYIKIPMISFHETNGKNK